MIEANRPSEFDEGFDECSSRGNFEWNTLRGRPHATKHSSIYLNDFQANIHANLIIFSQILRRFNLKIIKYNDSLTKTLWHCSSFKCGSDVLVKSSLPWWRGDNLWCHNNAVHHLRLQWSNWFRMHTRYNYVIVDQRHSWCQGFDILPYIFRYFRKVKDRIYGKWKCRVLKST